METSVHISISKVTQLIPSVKFVAFYSKNDTKLRNIHDILNILNILKINSRSVIKNISK
jgi:hypothetical protein